MFDKLMFFLSHGGLDLFLFILLIYFLYDVWVLYLEPLLTHEARQELEDRNLLLLKKHQLITLKKNCQADLEQQIDRIAQLKNQFKIWESTRKLAVDKLAKEHAVLAEKVIALRQQRAECLSWQAHEGKEIMLGLEKARQDLVKCYAGKKGSVILDKIVKELDGYASY